MNFDKIKRIIKLQRRNIWGNIWGRSKTKDQRGIALVTIIIIVVAALAATGTSIVVYNVVVDESEDTATDTAASQVEEVQDIPPDAVTTPPSTTSAPEQVPERGDLQPGLEPLDSGNQQGPGGGNQQAAPLDCPTIGERINTAGNACETFTCDTEGERFDSTGNACETFTCDTEGERLDSTGNACETFTCPTRGERLDSTGNACETFTCPRVERLDSTGNACEEAQRIFHIPRSSTPPPPITVALEMHVALSSVHGCVLLPDDGSVKCWGSNSRRQLGNACPGCLTTGYTTTPVTVDGLPPAKLIAAAQSTTCATLHDDVTLWCWGRLNPFGFGLFADDGHPPTEITTFSDRVRNLVLTVDNVCATLVSGQIECIGEDISENLGPSYVQGATLTTPARINHNFGSQAVDQFSTGTHSCALTRERKEVWCWGARNNRGQVGHIMPTTNIPRKVEGIPGRVSKIALGSDHTCVLLEDFRVFCWGYNGTGQSGPGVSDGDGGVLEFSHIPQEVGVNARVTTLAGLRGSDIATGDAGTCIVTNPNGDGSINVGGEPLGPLTPGGTNSNWKVLCWGYIGSLPTEGVTRALLLVDADPDDEVVSDSSDTVRIYGAAAIHCHVTINSQVRCWGRNDTGQRGAGPVPASGLGFSSILQAPIPGIP